MPAGWPRAGRLNPPAPAPALPPGTARRAGAPSTGPAWASARPAQAAAGRLVSSDALWSCGGTFSGSGPVPAGPAVAAHRADIRTGQSDIEQHLVAEAIELLM